MKTIEINKLRLIIEEKFPEMEHQLLCKDAFATGCFLHKSGHITAGRKLCYGVLNSLGFQSRSEFFSEIMESLKGNEEQFATSIWAHNEINQLFRK